MDRTPDKEDDERAAAGRPACGGCRCCPTGTSADGLEAQDASGLAGWRLVAYAAGVFLLPIFTALVGAAVAGGNETRRFAGLALGLAGGLVVAVAGARLIRWWHGLKEPQ